MKTNKLKKDFLFISPSLTGVLIFFIIPFGVVIYYSGIDGVVSRNPVGLGNYVNLMRNTAFQNAAKNTAVFSLFAVPLSIILSLGMSLVLEQSIPMKSVIRTFFLSPLMVPTASVVLIWQVMFDYHGVVNEAMKLMGLSSVDWIKSDYSQWVVVILFLWKNLGYNMVLFMSALSNIPKDILEVAKLDGVGMWKTFWYIKMRFITPSIFFVGIISLINSFKVFREVYLLAGDYPYDSLYMLQHFMNNTFRSLDYQKLSSAAIVMSLVMIVIIGILFISENKLSRDLEG
ncbi:MAG: sugar ABC transporter permease [Eubacterium sp.]|nr:sugar ABC transporter permease [Eubacterium sp.]